MILVLALTCIVLALMLVGSIAVNRELRVHLRDVIKERDSARQEVQAMTDAIARANRTPIIRQAEKPKLQPSEGYWDGRRELTKIVAE